MISEGKRSTPPYDIDEKIVKEAICEIYGKHIIRNPSVEFRVEDRVGASQIFPTVTCKLFTCTSLTYHCNEEDANKQIDPVSLMLLKDFQRKVVKEVKSTTLQIEFGRIHNIVKAKFSPEKIAEMVKEILHDKRGAITSKKTGITEKNDNMKIVKNFTEFLAESSQEKCSVCGKPVEKKAEYADICLSCEEKGYWEDPSGGVHSPDENDPAAMYESFTKDELESIKRDNKKMLLDSYTDFLRCPEEHKEVYARQVARTAKGAIKNRNASLEDWKNQFKHEKLVMAELKKLTESLNEAKAKSLGILPEHMGYAAKLMAIRNLAMEHYLDKVKSPEDLDYAWDRTAGDIQSETGESAMPELKDWQKEVKKGAKDPESYVSKEWNEFLQSIRGSIVSKETGIS